MEEKGKGDVALVFVCAVTIPWVVCEEDEVSAVDLVVIVLAPDEVTVAFVVET